MGDALQKDAELAARWITHGMRYRDQKQWVEALEAFEKSLALDARNPQAWSLKGRALDELGNLSEAIRCYKTSLELNPNSSSTWNNNGYALRKQQKYNLALECYREAVRLNPGYAKAWYNMGYVLDKLGNYESSLEAFDRAIELAPDNEKYVQSRKAVEATWREFQSVFDNASTASASSTTTNASSIGNSIETLASDRSLSSATSAMMSSQQQQTTSAAPPPQTQASIGQTSPTLSHLNHGSSSSGGTSSNNLNGVGVNNNHSAAAHGSNYRRRSGSAPNGEIPLHAAPQMMMNSGLGMGSGSNASLHATATHSDDLSATVFNPFLDFESSTLSLSTMSELISSAPPAALSRPVTPPNLSSTSFHIDTSLLPPISSSVPDSSTSGLSLASLGHISTQPIYSVGTSSAPISPLPLNAQTAEPSLFLRSSHNSANGSGLSLPLGAGIASDTMPIALQPIGRTHVVDEPQYAYIPHISHLRSQTHSASNSSPAITLSHHADRTLPNNATGEARHSANATNPTTLRSSTAHHRAPPSTSATNSSASAEDSSSSSTGSADGNGATLSFQSPQIIHSRSMSATVVSPRGHHSSSAHRTTTNSNMSTSNSSTTNHAASSNGGDKEMDRVPGGSHLASSDASSILNAIQQATTNGANGSAQPPSSTNTQSAMVASPDGSDGEHDLVHVGLPRARTYLEAIYSHLQNVKTVKDAEKLEKALEEMLAAVRVKRAFLNSKKSAENEDKCACCWEHPPEMVCIPCGHLCICEECKYKLRQKKCPICSQPVKNIYKVFK